MIYGLIIYGSGLVIGLVHARRERAFSTDDAYMMLLFAALTWPLAALVLIGLGAASAIDARQRPDTEEWLDPKGESAASEAGDAQTQSYSLKDVG